MEGLHLSLLSSLSRKKNYYHFVWKWLAISFLSHFLFVECASSSIHCPQLFSPICASYLSSNNGETKTSYETFANLCELKVAACSRGQDISVAFKGPCPGEDDSQPTFQPVLEAVEAAADENDQVENDCGNRVCAQVFTPVCGTNGKLPPTEV